MVHEQCSPIGKRLINDKPQSFYEGLGFFSFMRFGDDHSNMGNKKQPRSGIPFM